MAKESWMIVVFAAGILHCVGASSNPQEMANPEDTLAASASVEAKPPEFSDQALIAERRQGYYEEPYSEGGLLGFITDSAKYISEMFLDGPVRPREFSGVSVHDRNYRPVRVSVQSRYPPRHSGPDGPFFRAPNYHSFSHDPPPSPSSPPRSERSPPPFHRHARPPSGRHPDFRRAQSSKNSGFWTGSYSSHFKLFDANSDDIADNLHHQENNLIDRRHSSSESFSVNTRNELRTDDFDYERLLRYLEEQAYNKLRFPVETIDTRGKIDHHSWESAKSSGSFLWPDYEESSPKEQRETTYSLENFFDYENSEYSGPTSFQSFQRGSSFDSVEISDNDKWEQWGKLIGKNPSTERLKSDLRSNSKQSSKLSGSQNTRSFKSNANPNSVSHTKNKNEFAPFHSVATFPKAREQIGFSAHLKQDSFLSPESHNSFSGIRSSHVNYGANNFKNTSSATKDNHKSITAPNFQNSAITVANYEDGFIASNTRKSFTVPTIQPLFLTPSTLDSSDKKHSVGNVVDALKIVVDALENTPSEEKIYIAKTSPRPSTAIDFNFSPPDTQRAGFGSEWTPLI